MYTSSIQNSIKIVIWDLDETVFDGILAEDHHLKLKDGIKDIIIELSRRGILNSVCSFNDYTVAKDKLIEFGLWDYFVFPQISYRSKADSIKKMLSDIHLLSDNALFVDNDERQLAHVKQVLLNINLLNAYYYKDILVNAYVQGEANDNFSRLGQYKVLEAREQESQKFNNDTDFLMSLNLTIKIEKFSEKEEERVNKLLSRAHQLNYASSADCELSDGYCVHAYDKFGDMGLVGYYNLQFNELKCFVFSCRVINLGIEQWVYSYLGCPNLEANENVAVRLIKTNKMSPHITLNFDEETFAMESKELNLPAHLQKVLNVYLYGACEMHRCSSLIDLPNINMQLDYNAFFKDYRTLNAGSEYIRQCFEQTSAQKKFLTEHFSNYTGDDVFKLKIKDDKYDVALFSFSDDAICYLYHHKNDVDFKVMGENQYGMPRVYVNNDGSTTTMRTNQWFNENFIEEGFISMQRFEENLTLIRKMLPQDTLIVLFEIPECKNAKRGEKQKKDIFDQIKMLNSVMTRFCQNKENNAEFLRTTHIVDNDNGYSDYFLHWSLCACNKVIGDVFETMSRCISPKIENHGNERVTVLSNDFTGTLIQRVYQIAGVQAELLKVECQSKEHISKKLESILITPKHFIVNATGEHYSTSHNIYDLKRMQKNVKNNFVPKFYSYSYILKDYQGFNSQYLNAISKFESIYIPIYFCTLCQPQASSEIKGLNPYTMDLDEYFDLAKDVKHISYRECAEYFILDNATIFSGMDIVQIADVYYTLSPKFEKTNFYQDACLNKKVLKKKITSFTREEWEEVIQKFAYSVKRVYGKKVIFIEPVYSGIEDDLYELYVETNQIIKEVLDCRTITTGARIERFSHDFKTSYDSQMLEEQIERFLKEMLNV